MIRHTTPKHIATIAALLITGSHANGQVAEQTLPLSSLAIEKGTHLTNTLGGVVSEISLTDSAAVFARFGIHSFTSTLRPDHVRSAPGRGTSLAVAGFVALELHPYLATVPASASEIVVANSARLAGMFDPRVACVTLEAVRSVFGASFLINPTTVTAPYGAATTPTPASPTHSTALPGVRYEQVQFVRGQKGLVSFTFNKKQCAHSFILSTSL